VIAKIASNEHKPDGLTVVCEDEAEAFLEPPPVLDRRENPHRKALRLVGVRDSTGGPALALLTQRFFAFL